MNLRPSVVLKCFGMLLLIATVLCAPTRGAVKLLVPGGYLPGVPFLVRVEARTESGERDMHLWNSEATLSSDQGGIVLSTNKVQLRNGVGTALLTINGSTDFTLRVRHGQEQAARTISNRSGEQVRQVSGTLTGASTTWSGVVRITGTVTVPVGHTLTIDSHTLVLVDGAGSGNSGNGLIVQGSLRSLGSELFPVTITCSSATQNWGQIRHVDAQPSVYQHTLISKAGRVPGEGHTSTGPAVRANNSTISFVHSVISDLQAGGEMIGKIMMATGSTLAVDNTVFARARMGPEIASTSLVLSNSWVIEMTGPDDADGIYLHDSGNRELTISKCVFAGGDDDAIDTLNARVVVENSILRDWPNPNEDAKGVSGFNGEVILRKCVIANCHVGVATKSNSSEARAVIRMDRCTVIGNQRGVSAATKSNATVGNIAIYMTNSIVRAPDSLHSDFGADRFASVSFSNLGETWTGAGNITSDPRFVNAGAWDFRLQDSSPCIDAGDPNSVSDLDGSRADMGAYPGKSQAGGLFVTITAPPAGALIPGPTNILLTAAINSSAPLSSVRYVANGTLAGEATASPWSFAWNNVPVGNYTLVAIGRQTGGLMATSAPVSFSVTATEGRSTNVLIGVGSEWRYLDDGSDQGSAWTAVGFNDSAWKTGQAQFGYGDQDEMTVISFGPSSGNKYPTTYFRKSISLQQSWRVEELYLALLRDDGAIVYVNGQEAVRVSMPNEVNYLTYATDAGEYDWNFFSIDPSLLREGENVVAVEVHQGNAGSSDMSFDLEIVGVFAAPSGRAPLVALTNPSRELIIGAPGNLVLEADALDLDGTVANVQFRAKQAVLGSDNSRPYTFAWSNVPAGEYLLDAVAFDNSGLSATSAAVRVTVSADIHPPRVAAQTPAPGSATNLSEVEVVFSKPVQGVDAADLLINGQPAESVSGTGTTYRFEFPTVPIGVAQITWAPGSNIQDFFTPPNTFNPAGAGATWQYQVVDTIAPIMRGLLPGTGRTVSSLGSITLSFSESVSGVGAQDLLMNGFAATSVSGSGAGPYLFTFNSPAPGQVRLSWREGHGIVDGGNNSFGGGSWTYLLDPTQPTVVISEIMYHPMSENSLEEFIELHNYGSAAVNLKGWRFSDGVDFEFPDVTIPGGGYLAVAADVDVFKALYPEVSNVVGGWGGTLSNSGEDVDLDDALEERVDSVFYADEGEWAVRQRGILDRGRRGWRWFSEHDGLGKSLELINAQVSNNNGQNWGSSLAAGGTPGRANSIGAENIAPLIETVSHFPIVPRSTDAVTISARVTDESDVNLPVTLAYRVSVVSPGEFSETAMVDDGTNGDASAGDGIYTAMVPALPNNTVVEFFISAEDSSGLRRTWPAPAIAALDNAGPSGQVVNALYQVDDTPYAGRQPLYKVIMTETERQELADIGNNVGGSAQSDAQMNATFLSMNGAGAEVRYLVGIRNRGHGSRGLKPNNYRVNFRSDEPWNEMKALNINGQYSWLQVLGAALNLKSGVSGAYSTPVQFRVNNGNLAFTGATDRTFGSYAANEAINGDWADRHFPEDSEGNVYRAIRDIAPSNFDYRTQAAYPGLSGPENPNSYRNTWFKESNVSEDDWTDLIGMLRVFGLNGTEPFTRENLDEVINVDQWLRHLAVMNLLGNGETGLNSGYNDDYYMYRGVDDPRFILMYYDLDQILGVGGSFGTASSIFTATSTGANQGSGAAFGRFLMDPQIQPLYLAHLKQLVESTFSAASFDALVDQTLGAFVPEGNRRQLKNWMNNRRASVLAQLPEGLLPPPLTVVQGIPRSPTPLSSATLTVEGQHITHYRYRVNDQPYGVETPVNVPISLSGLPAGNVTLSVIGKNSNGVWQSEGAPTVATWAVNPAWPALRLNEVAASRSNNQPDVIELFNESGAVLNLSGMGLTDDPDLPRRYVFGDVTVAAGGHIALTEAQLGFGLSADGEGVYLFDAPSRGGGLLDWVEFGNQLRDFSIGRVGAAGAWRLTPVSPGTANTAQPTGDLKGVRINEWLAVGAAPFSDPYIELFNPATMPVDIGRSYLSDHPFGAPTRSPIPPLTFIAARGYMTFTEGNGDPGEFDFVMSGQLGEIALLAPDGTTIDHVVYGPQTRGVASGLCPDGGNAIRLLEGPTPGAPNQCPFIPEPPQAVTLVPFDHVWRYEASNTDLGVEWRALNYNDANWTPGPGPLGFDDDPLPEALRTVISNSGSRTYYFRTTFNGAVPANATTMLLTFMVDDGAAFYLNGQELTRYNLGANATHNSLASANLGDAVINTVNFPPELIRPGVNELAVEVHQITQGSSDMVMGLKLEALIINNTPADAGVVINELLAHNESFALPDRRKPDWVEIYNPSTNTVDLGGMSLSDSASNPQRWVFPGGSLLPGKGFFVVQCDGTLPASSTNSGFGLKANSGSVYLYANSTGGSQLISSINYGLQAPDWSIGRVPDGEGTWVLTVPSFGIANSAAALGSAANLKVNEWLADPASGEDWFEIFNPNGTPVELSGLALSDNLSSRLKSILPPLSFIGNGVYGFHRFFADELTAQGTDHVNFKLSASGEAVAISTGAGVLIDGVSFGLQSRGVSEGRLVDGSANIVRFPASASPGSPNYLPDPRIVINELLSHSDLPLEDAVELHNISADTVDISGWYLSDSPLNLKQYQVPANTHIPPGGYLVLYENQFNNELSRFSFNSADGDEVYLSEAVNGVLTGYRAAASFGPAENGVSFGRHMTSQGAHFVALSRRTFGMDNPSTVEQFRTGTGAANAAPKLGPLVISEVMYNPAIADEALEFVELHNNSGQTVQLSHPNHPAITWRMRRGIDLDFAQGISIPPGGYLVLVNFDPAFDSPARQAFLAAYGEGISLAGPYSGALNNAGEAIELQRPDAPEANGDVPYILVERLEYADRAPWPASADGSGHSLHRVALLTYSNDPMNWTAGDPSPGRGAASTDNDNDGMPNAWELEHQLDPNDPADAAMDKDGDGVSNLEEFLRRTSPVDPADPLRFHGVRKVAQGIELRFHAPQNGRAVIQVSNNSPAGPWQPLTGASVRTEGAATVVLDVNPGPSSRFYRLAAQPN